MRGADGVEYEAVIGLEVHAELRTRTKMFSGAPNAFGGAPNVNIDPTSLGLPGSLPVLNRRAVGLAIRFGLAVGSTIQRAIFHRKNYFYPDMPKDFQISQYDEPICAGGEIEAIDDAGGLHTVRLVRAHLEEDTGKLVHRGGGGRIHEADSSLVDYNRAGVPLLEIVSEPDIRSPAQARAYVNELRAILRELDVSDVKMEEGSLRVDANISVRAVGDTRLGTRAEIKNMNSVRSLQRALEFEFERQVRICAARGEVVQETRHWNEEDGQTHSMRSKEEAFDYRYFPEPDLVPIVPDPAWVEEIRAGLPELLPARRVQAVCGTHGVSADLVMSVVYTPGLADWVDAEVAAGADAGRAYVWASQEVLAHMNETGTAVSGLRIPARAFVELTELTRDGTLSSKLAKQVLRAVLDSGRSPREVVEEEGLAQISDSGELEGIVAGVLDSNPEAVEKYRAGEEKVIGFLVGQVMKATQGKANPGQVNEILRARIGS
ncbi:MAG: Asp-tRNA(Asn)/Glu-tRNA(Gln) amidotransferase subunit GatB [Acidimicrobiia bacterium]|nr:Asp-tRNA(Asn)/Glu-tRNA(Gln) amidotransferase subunit GatB [Acidimicrobiia bacterium]